MTPEAIAAEVAARYGIPVNPAVVKILPARVAVEPDCYWNGQYLVAKEHGRHKVKAAIHAQVMQATAARNNATKEKAVHRRADLRVFAADKTIDQIATYMGCNPASARRYMNRHGIAWVKA